MKNKILMLLMPLFLVACGEVSSSSIGISQTSSSTVEVTTENITPSDGQTTTSEDLPVVKYYSVSGLIKDNQDGVVSKATVKLYNDNFTQTQTTNSQGVFKFENVPAGEYHFTILEAESDAWKLEQYKGVSVTVSGDSLDYVMDDVVIEKDPTFWGPIYGG